MKNYLHTFKAKKCLFLLCMLIGFQSYAQDTNSDDRYNIGNRKNEIRFDAFDAAFLGALDLSYERVDNMDTGYGISVFANFREDGYNEKFAITPFFRFYFFNKQDYGAKGLFVEIFGKFASGEYEVFSEQRSSFVDEDYFDMALGLTIGKKWVNRKGFMLEISFGGGRNLGFDDNSPDFAIRGGISLGYRF